FRRVLFRSLMYCCCIHGIIHLHQQKYPVFGPAVGRYPAWLVVNIRHGELANLRRNHILRPINRGNKHMGKPPFIHGGIAEDHRGSIRFVNDFDMAAVKRFYIIENKDTETIRGWRAHRIEQRWFYVLEGAFSLKAVKIDDWEEA